MLDLKLFCFLISTLKEHISLHVYKYWFEPETLLWVVLCGYTLTTPNFEGTIIMAVLSGMLLVK